jgi:hypothetical protein
MTSSKSRGRVGAGGEVRWDRDGVIPCCAETEGSFPSIPRAPCTVRVLLSFAADHPFTCLSMNDDHNVAAGTTNGDILIYDIRYKGVVTSWQAHHQPISSLTFQPPKVGWGRGVLGQCS